MLSTGCSFRSISAASSACRRSWPGTWGSAASSSTATPCSLETPSSPWQQLFPWASRGPCSSASR
eukprot:3139579-Lingulodinium_polyedra.AAC.1